jgi:Tol biopolymer transport system component
MSREVCQSASRLDGRDAAPVWSPDGQKIAWQGNAEMYSKAANGAGSDERLRNEPLIPDEWRDGTLLCHPIAPRQLLALTVGGAERTPQPVVEGRTITTQARLSPDGQWIAFASNDSGRMEVYLQKYPKGDGWSLVSASGGLQPKWGRDGKELFYLALDGNIMAVPLTLGTLVEIGKPRRLFQTRIDSSTGVVWHQCRSLTRRALPREYSGSHHQRRHGGAQLAGAPER